MNQDKILNEIENNQKNIRYDTKEYTIEIIVDKYLDELDLNNNEFYVPDYQREFVWSFIRQSKFIESLIIGLPIPYIFLAQDNEKRYEIVDGSQRIRTLAAFLSNQLKLQKLEVIPSLNGVTFSDLPKPIQREFKNISLKMITLSSQTTAETKNEIFERINRGSDLLKDMESRKGIYRGKFNDFVYELAKNPKFISLTPIETWFANRQEREELLLRFFALKDFYPHYNQLPGIARQLDSYFENKNMPNNFLEKERIVKTEGFLNMMNFVETYFRHGFSKHGSRQVSRV